MQKEMREYEWTKVSLERLTGIDLTDKQAKVLRVALRNPYTGVSTAAKEADVSTQVLTNAFWALEYGDELSGENFDHDPRLNKGPDWFTDKTLKQRASIDFLARHPDAYESHTWKEVAEKVLEETGVACHWVTIGSYADKFKHLIHKRREWYERRGKEHEIQPFDGDKSKSDPRSLRQKLLDAGIPSDKLPSENLDGLPTSGEAKEEGRSKGGSQGGSQKPRPTEPSGEDDTGDDGDGEEVTVDRGNTSYKGPSTGLNLGSGRPSKLLVDRDGDGPDVTAEIEALYDEYGPYGQGVMDRDLEIDSKEDLATEIKLLRMLVATQGKYIDQLRRALDNLHISVDAGFTIPDDAERELQEQRGDDE